MAESTQVFTSTGQAPSAAEAPRDPCLLVLFGASGDLTKRLLMPALYNLACDGLLPAHFAILGTAMDAMTTEEFRARMTQDIRQFSTRKEFDPAPWDRLAKVMHYTPARFDDEAAFGRLAQLARQLDRDHQLGGKMLFYMATPPSVFGLISDQLEKADLRGQEHGWKRIIVEKPFGTDLPSAVKLNREILRYWDESQVYRIDHYLGKETVQNLLAFRFANALFEPLWNKHFIDHVQFTVSEVVGVEGRGNYYDRSGVLRDMIQNHMFQMLAYFCMEPPSSFSADAVRDEKVKLLRAVRQMKPEDVPANTVRGQYGPGTKADGTPTVGYRQEPGVPPASNTETFASLRLFIDNWRWEGVPMYLRSGKSLWKRGTEIVVQFKKAPEVLFRGTPVDRLDSNRLIFHIQPDQAIELQFEAKIPGPLMRLQDVNMRFGYSEAFKAARATGYEVMLYSAMIGDATLFSRTDMVETAWQIAQPILDSWSSNRPGDFPNYPSGSWGPKEAFDLIERDGRKWVEVINRDVLAAVPLLKDTDPVFLNALSLVLKPVVVEAGQTILRKGDTGQEMYLICRGDVEVLGDRGEVVKQLGAGDYFGEIGLLLAQPRTATVRARSYCDLFVLEKADFGKVLRYHPQVVAPILDTARNRYKLAVGADNLVGREVAQHLAGSPPA
jgi:glucose-6-phosphate 1-dehydrogenase